MTVFNIAHSFENGQLAVRCFIKIIDNASCTFEMKKKAFSDLANFVICETKKREALVQLRPSVERIAAYKEYANQSNWEHFMIYEMILKTKNSDDEDSWDKNA